MSGVSVEAMHAAIRSARLVIAQLNGAMPRTLGESFIHVDEIDLAVEVDVAPYERPVGAIGGLQRGGRGHAALRAEPAQEDFGGGRTKSR